MSRENQFSVTLTIDERDLGIWDKHEGGAKDSEDTKYKPGAMGEEISLGGSTTVENVTLSRLYDLTRDNPIEKWLLSRVGKGWCVATKQPLDVEANALGTPLVYRGRLKAVTPPDHDSESDDAALIALEISAAGSIG